MDWEELERIACELAEALVRQVDGVVLEVKCGRPSRWRGVSKFAHQIDVLVLGPNDLLLAECKRWKRAISPGAVLAFYGRLVDIRPTFAGKVHGVMVSTRKPASGALTLARHFGIDCAIVQSPQEFGLKYKNLHWQGLAGSVSFSGSLEMTVTRGKKRE